MALADARTVIRAVRLRGGLVAPDSGSLSNSGAGGWVGGWWPGEKSGSERSLTSELIFHADARSEVVFWVFFLFFFQEMIRPPPPPL